MNQVPFYNPNLSYEDNYTQGPFGLFAQIPKEKATFKAPQQTFLGLKVSSTFGIPAGPLLNSRFIQAAFAHGFDLCTYKTVRSLAYPCHPLPNILRVETADRLEPDQTLFAHKIRNETPLAITNSFGVPSMSPEIWQADMAKAAKLAASGQIMIASFQGSGKDEAQIQDYFHTAQLVMETGALVLEANLSCPNEGRSGLLCFDRDKVKAIVIGLRKILHDRPLLIKLAYFENSQALAELVQEVGNMVDGFCVINTIPAKVVNQNNQLALPEREQSGICGAPIRWAGLKMVAQLAALRANNQQNFAIIGNGGVITPTDYQAYRLAGADAVMSATGAMWNPNLAQEIKQENQ